jgi:hypothetical protein
VSRPLLADPKRKSEAARFHAAVFARWGRSCVLCDRKAPAVDAAHVLGRAHLGPHRYASEHFGRPLHRDCHDRVDRSEIRWPRSIVRDAIRHFNKIAKVKMRLPEPTSKREEA